MSDNKLIAGSKGGKGGGGSARTPVEDPDSLRSKQYARVVDLLGEGEWESVGVNGLESIYFDDTPIKNADDSYNFGDVDLQSRNGTQSQTYILNSSDVESEVPVGAQFKADSGDVTRQITDPNLDVIRVTLSIPRLTIQDVTTGDIHGSVVNYKIELQADGGGFTTVIDAAFNGKTTTKFQRSHDILLIGDAPWDIRVSRSTADSVSSTLQNQTWWDSYTKIISSKLSYPNSVVVGIKIDAAQFRTVPKRSYDCKMLKAKIPSNYNPITRVYTDTWDGTFTVAWTDNPAWCFYDLLINDRYGLGSFIDSNFIDKWTLYEISEYCDELVDDGFGGTEPRFTCNLYLQKREEAYNVLRNMASIFRSMIYWSTAGIVAVQDKPEQIFAQFTNASVVNGLFNYEGSASKSRHTVALVSWNDPNDRYKLKVEYIEDQDGISKLGINETEIVAIGCTSRGQAHRIGKWLLYSENTETEMVTFQVGLEGTQLTPGKIIRTIDQHRAGARNGGRIISANGTSIVIDNQVTLENSETYILSAVLPDGTLEDRQVINMPGVYTTITISSSFTNDPVNFSIWVITASNLSPEEWRVISITENDKNLFNVSALEYNSSKFAAVEQDLLLEVKDSTIISNTTDVVTEITIEESLYEINPGTYGTKIHLGWLPPNNTARFNVRYKCNNENFIEVETKNSQLELYNENYGEFIFEIVAYNALGVPSPTVIYKKTLLGITEPPSDVTGFVINVLGDTAYLSWDEVTDIDLSHYIIKFSNATTGATWGSAVPLVSKVSKPATSITVPAMVGTYLIKASDFVPILSVNTTLISNTTSALDSLNVVETAIEHTLFSGIHVNTETLNGVLRLESDTIDTWITLDSVINMYYGVDGVSSTGTYYFDNVIDLGAIFTSRVTANINVYGQNIIEFISGWDSLNNVENMSGSDPSLWSISLEIRTTQDDPTGSPIWSEWSQLLVGDYTAWGAEFRVILNSFSNNISPYIDTLSVTIDMEDRVYGEYDLVCITGGLSIVYDPAFNALPAIGISAQGLQTGDYYEMTSRSATGFDIVFKDSGGTAIQRTFDYVAKGYGYVN